MPKRTNAYQRIVTLLNATLADSARVTESAMVKDKVTQEEREVDVVITARAANYDVTIGIEVVAWKRRADTPWVEKMHAKHANLEIDKLILVSKSGFTKPAITKAKFYNIECLTLEAACATDWPLVTKLQSEGVFQLTNLKYDCTIICDFGDGEKEHIEAPLNATLSLLGSHFTLDDFVREIVNKPEFRDALYPHIKSNTEQDFWFSYTKPGGLWKIEHNGRTGQVQELRVELKILQSETPVQYATGKFRETPFVAGVSASGKLPLQFVLAKTPDGAVKGHLVDKTGIRALSSFREKQNQT